MTKKLLTLSLLVLPAIVVAQQSDLFGNSNQVNVFGQPKQSTPDPVRWQLQNQPGGWIHSPDRDPVKHELREWSWIFTQPKDPVKYQMQKDSWIHGSIHDAD